MGLFQAAPKNPDEEDLEKMETDELLKGARRYEAELQRRRDNFQDSGRIGRIKSLGEFQRVKEFLGE